MKPDDGIPDEKEQEEAWEYVCKRELPRPNTNIMRAVRYIMAFTGIDVLVTLICGYLMPYFCQNSLFLDFVIITLIGLLLVSKKALIGLVRLYQHYAPDRIRRKCIFKPTCSEYMILAVEKYGLFKGLYKGIYRMFFKCKGFYYSVDYP
jgi:putative component of membrane protein insertase Oxa1/YidC/SpoIIIJ protein YidD